MKQASAEKKRACDPRALCTLVSPQRSYVSHFSLPFWTPATQARVVKGVDRDSPVLTFTVLFFHQTPTITLPGFLSALSWTVDKQFEDRDNLKNDN